MQPIKFQVQIKKTQRADHHNSVTIPNDGSNYVLVFNHDWNDYGYRIAFALWYFPDGKKKCLGELKILHKTATNTFNEIKQGFEGTLMDDFCSLGNSTSYYTNLVSELGVDQAKRVLRALRDCAADKQIFEDWHNHHMFDMTIGRDLLVDRIRREVPLILSGLRPEEIFSFNYSFHSPANHEIEGSWKVDLSYQPRRFRRIVGIIGENGVGKTRMLSDFVKDFFNPELIGFNRKPMFNGITVISSTSHDYYPKIADIQKLHHDNAKPNYNSFFLDNLSTNKGELVNQIQSIENRGTIRGRSLLSEFQKCVEVCIGKELSDFFMIVTKSIKLTNDIGEICEDIIETTTIDRQKLEYTVNILSSGQLFSLAVLSYAFANVHMGCLLILDEPEVHLHPSVIINLMIILTTVLNVFEGYCIIATHSPLIIRELVRENVFRMTKFDGQIPMLNKVAFDTFGEDISLLYQRIFGYNEKNSLFTITVKNIKKHTPDINVDKICEIVGTDGKINLNARLRIASILSLQD